MSKLLIADCTSRSDSRRKARRSASSEHLEGEQGEVIVGMPVPWALSQSCLHLGALPAMALGEEPGLRAATGSGRWRVDLRLIFGRAIFAQDPRIAAFNWDR